MKTRLTRWFYNQLLELFESERYDVFLYHNDVTIMAMNATLEAIKPYRFRGLSQHYGTLNDTHSKLVLEPDNIVVHFAEADSDGSRYIKSKCKNIEFTVSAELKEGVKTEISFEPVDPVLLIDESFEDTESYLEQGN